jgi:hypothetical protein
MGVIPSEIYFSGAEGPAVVFALYQGLALAMPQWLQNNRGL